VFDGFGPRLRFFACPLRLGFASPLIGHLLDFDLAGCVPLHALGSPLTPPVRRVLVPTQAHQLVEVHAQVRRRQPELLIEEPPDHTDVHDLRDLPDEPALAPRRVDNDPAAPSALVVPDAVADGLDVVLIGHNCDDPGGDEPLLRSRGERALAAVVAEDLHAGGDRLT
jgi:hypothetical protein